MEGAQGKNTPGTSSTMKASGVNTTSKTTGMGKEKKSWAPKEKRKWSIDDLHIVFYFYNDNPQKARRAVEEQEAEEVPSEVLSMAPYWTTIREFQESDLFLEGMLLKSLDKDAKYPYVHYIVYNNRNSKGKASSETRVDAGPCPPSSGIFVDLLESQGGYREMYSFVDHRTPLMPKRPQSPLAAYILSAFKVFGNLEDLDRTWSYWSGADLVVESVPRSLLLQRLTFHKTKYDVGSDVFAYVMLCELGDALADVEKTMQFVQLLKNRQCGFASLYTIDHFF